MTANSCESKSPPEVFQCALDLTTGYSFEVDWWSLGVCVYEMLCGQRPFDIHSTTKLEQIITMQRDEILKFPTNVTTPFAHLIQRLLNFKREDRVASIADLKNRCSFCKDINFDAVYEMKVQPAFVPPKNQLNCDPTFELEEMIIEANPLHKKKKRLLKQQSVKRIVLEHQNSSSLSESGGNYEETNQENVPLEFPVYNREKELQKRQIEEKEKLWEEELNKIIS
ncbi:Serine/threonine-protein kinase 32B-like protein [Leptotrombidium deliense]|uniref:Serine/threonine-protein kinase 32B-like protein n=1 Tax=Leptotrombidium deliense TaxID=299467 RepID=A0A443S3Y7_9ACAR|nr:Serine/threonine-protein kinase 32B-like protein [Leptotrombidium deliense]